MNTIKAAIGMASSKSRNEFGKCPEIIVSELVALASCLVRGHPSLARPDIGQFYRRYKAAIDSRNEVLFVVVARLLQVVNPALTHFAFGHLIESDRRSGGLSGVAIAGHFRLDNVCGSRRAAAVHFPSDDSDDVGKAGLSARLLSRAKKMNSIFELYEQLASENRRWSKQSSRESHRRSWPHAKRRLAQIGCIGQSESFNSREFITPRSRPTLW